MRTFYDVQSIAFFFNSLLSFIFISLTLGLRTSAVAAPEPRLTRALVSNAERSFSDLREVLFQVKTASSENAEKSSYGTGFVVDERGYLITNYHVIQSSIWYPESQKVFVSFQGKNVAAQVIDVDVVHDLALVKIENQFKRKIKVASVLPNRGEQLHSLGLPEDLDWTVVNGVFNGPIIRGPYELFHLTTPLNPGMSGGPTVNGRSELVGVNVSGLLRSQNISFAVPLKFVLPLIEKAKAQTKGAPLDESISRQLTEAQEKLTDLTLDSLKSKKTLEAWSVPKFTSDFRCWGQKSTDSEKFFNVVLERCDLEHSSLINRDISSGFVKFEVSQMSNQGLNALAFHGLINSDWPRDEVEMNQAFLKSQRLNYGPFSCMNSRVQGQSIDLEVCSRAMIPYNTLFEFHIKALRKTKDRAIKQLLILDGFTAKNLRKILEVFLAEFPTTTSKPNEVYR